MYAPESDYAFDKDLTERLRTYRAPVKKGLRKWSAGQLFMLVEPARQVDFIGIHVSPTALAEIGNHRQVSALGLVIPRELRKRYFPTAIGTRKSLAVDR